MENLQISSRISAVQSRIEQACAEAQRLSDSVRLLAVSKTKPLSQLVEAYQSGQRHFGENYAQELVEKHQQAPFRDAIWHFIGPLQSNKTKLIAEHADWVHTVDRTKIAQRLNDQRPENLAPLNVLIQVNISNDPAKAGILPSQVLSFAEKISALPNLTLRGLMTITANGLDSQALAEQFGQLKKLQSTLIKDHASCTELSMGMSSDFDIAIAQGSTIVRVGSDIFGAREAKN